MTTVQLEDLIGQADRIINGYRETGTFDITGFLRIGYETYWYFKSKEAPRKIEPCELNLIRYFAVPDGFETYPENCDSYEFDACIHFSKNLIDEISEDFPGYYLPNEMVITRYYDCPAGCSDYSVDMSSFETFREGLMNFFEEDTEEYDD